MQDARGAAQATRRGLTNARFNEENSNIFLGEIVVIAIAVGLWAHSWWAFGGALLGLFLALRVPVLALILVVLLSAGWGFIGWAIGTMFANLGAQVVLATLAFVAGLGAHLSGLEWVQDISQG